MEALSYGLVLAAGLLVLRRPERERLAFALLVAAALLTVGLFLLGTRTSFLPPMNL